MLSIYYTRNPDVLYITNAREFGCLLKRPIIFVRDIYIFRKTTSFCRSITSEHYIWYRARYGHVSIVRPSNITSTATNDKGGRALYYNIYTNGNRRSPSSPTKLRSEWSSAMNPLCTIRHRKRGGAKKEETKKRMKDVSTKARKWP